MLSKRIRSGSDDESSIDISNVLTGKRRRTQPEDDSDDDLGEFIRTSIAKRDIKLGTEVVKNAKGKNKLAKGELGGGSFQSMGTLST